MTKSWFIPSSAHRLAQPHRLRTLVQSDAKGRARKAQQFISWTDEGQCHSPTSWSTAFKTQIKASVVGTDPTEDALSP